MEIHKKLQQIRENKKISRDTMAEHLSISPYNLRNIEYGEVRLTLENFLLMCEYLEIPPLSLIDTNNNYIVINEQDKEEIEKAINVLHKIKFQIDNTEKEKSKNINIGNNNNINNSFNN